VLLASVYREWERGGETEMENERDMSANLTVCIHREGVRASERERANECKNTTSGARERMRERMSESESSHKYIFLLQTAQPKLSSERFEFVRNGR